LSVNSRRLSGWKTLRRAIWSSLQGEKRPLDGPISITKQSFSCRPSPSPSADAFKIVFQLELLSDRAPLELHEPDNFDTFVSSPLLRLKCRAKRALGSEKRLFGKCCGGCPLPQRSERQGCGGNVGSARGGKATCCVDTEKVSSPRVFMTIAPLLNYPIMGVFAHPRKKV
jgi:hypothetical protein